MNTLKKVRFKVAWQSYRVGDEITPNGTLRDWLVGNGYVDVVDDDLGPTKSLTDREIRRGTKRKVNGQANQNRLIG